MFLHVCKQTFRKFYGYITREFLGLRMRNFQGIIFIWTQAYREIFKSAFRVPLSSYWDSWWRHKLRFIYDQPHHDWQGEKKGKTETRKFEYLENDKSFLDEIIKKISPWRASIWWEIKIWSKIADTNFKDAWTQHFIKEN